MITSPLRAAADVPIPPAGYCTRFVDAATGLPAAKLHDGTVVSMRGDQGPPGAGLPEGGTPGQVVVKTSEGAAWADPAGGNAPTGTWINLLPPEGAATDGSNSPLEDARVSGQINLGGM